MQPPQPLAPTPVPSSPAGAGIQATPAPAAGPGVAGGFTMQMDKVPSAAELMDLPEGTQVMTPYGTVDREGNLTLSEEGKIKYQQAKVAKVKEFGLHPLGSIPGIAPLPIELGRPSYNPWTNQWLDSSWMSRGGRR